MREQMVQTGLQSPSLVKLLCENGVQERSAVVRSRSAVSQR